MFWSVGKTVVMMNEVLVSSLVSGGDVGLAGGCIVCNNLHVSGEHADDDGCAVDAAVSN